MYTAKENTLNLYQGGITLPEDDDCLPAVNELSSEAASLVTWHLQNSQLDD